MILSDKLVGYEWKWILESILYEKVKQGSKKVYFNYEVDLKGIKEERQSVYYEFVNEKGSNIFKIKNKKQCKIGKLNIVVKCYVPTHENDDKFLITNTFEFELGGIY